jgi:hypothetical protein
MRQNHMLKAGPQAQLFYHGVEWHWKIDRRRSTGLSIYKLHEILDANKGAQAINHDKNFQTAKTSKSRN